MGEKSVWAVGQRHGAARETGWRWLTTGFLKGKPDTGTKAQGLTFIGTGALNLRVACVKLREIEVGDSLRNAMRRKAK